MYEVICDVFIVSSEWTELRCSVSVVHARETEAQGSDSIVYAAISGYVSGSKRCSSPFGKSLCI